jgi:hypothetical protein
VIDQV